MSLLDFDAFRRTPLVREPFEYLIVPKFLKPENIPAISADYPQIEQGGSFPLGHLQYGSAFDALQKALQGPERRQAFEEKFAIDLSGRPTTLTVRGRCRMKDGKIHIDSRTKLITVLLYMNQSWEAPGGRLRLLRNQHDINDYIAETPPEQGTLVCFMNRTNAWHGHLPFDGERRVLQLNWVTDQSAVDSSERRHGWSAWFKKLLPKSWAA